MSISYHNRNLITNTDHNTNIGKKKQIKNLVSITITNRI